jgi:Lon-like ATP-dependent protease
MSNDTDNDDSPPEQGAGAPEETVHADDSERADDADVPTDLGAPDGESRPDEAGDAEEAEKRTIDDLGSDVEVTAEVADDPDDDDLLGGLRIESTEEIEVPDRLVDQVIGQEHARDVIMKAAKQRRHVMMIGSPGTGKSMLAKAMAELLPK